MAIAWDPSLAADDLWERLHEHFTEPQLVELGHFIALTLGQQRFLKTVAIRHGEVLAGHRCGPGAGGRPSGSVPRAGPLIRSRTPAVAESSRYKSDADWGTRPNSGSERPRDRRAHAPADQWGPGRRRHRTRQRSPNAAWEAACLISGPLGNQWSAYTAIERLGLRNVVRLFGGPAYVPRSPARSRVWPFGNRGRRGCLREGVAGQSISPSARARLTASARLCTPSFL